MKKYKGWEIAKLISEEKLEGKEIQKITNYRGDDVTETGINYKIENNELIHIEFNKGATSYSLTNAKSEYIIIQEPVTFMEAITSGKRIKCVHNRFTRSNEYLSIFVMFKNMSKSPMDDFIPTLVKEGKWYIEEADNE